MLDALGLTIISLRANGRSRDGLLAVAFFVIVPRRLQRLFPTETFTVRLLLYQVRVRVLLLDGWDYTQEGGERQEKIRLFSRCIILEVECQYKEVVIPVS